MKVNTAYMQTGVTILGHCSQETNFNPTKFPSLKMTYGPLGLEMDFGAVKAIVPPANVKAVVLENVEVVSEAKKSK